MSKPGSSRKWIRAFCLLAIVAAALLGLLPLKRLSVSPIQSAKSSRPQPAIGASATRKPIEAGFAAVPLAFERNQGQTDAKVNYLARGNGYTLFLTANDAVFALRSRHVESAASKLRRGPELSANDSWQSDDVNNSTAVVRMRLVGANPAKIAASEILPGVANYFLGNDPGKWRGNVPLYARISYRDIYPGVSMAFHGAQRQPEFDFVVAPGASPAVIGIDFTGQRSIAMNDSGDLVIASAAGNVLLHKPIAYQERNGVRQLIDARFALNSGNQIGFALGNYDRNRELVIDPSVSYAYSSYLGGTAEDDGFGIAFDSSGNTYVTGETASANFPGAANANAGNFDVFVTKISANGSTLIYSTYVGGTNADSGNAIAVNQTTGAAFIAGGSVSTDFPTTTGAYQTTLSGSTGNAVLFELNPTGTLAYGTYLGGTGTDTALGLALDASGDLYTVGETSSTNFPIKSPLQSSVAGGFLAKINPAGGGTSDLVFATYLGAASGDYAGAIALDSSANIYVTGKTTSASFPATSGVVQPSYGGGTADAFVASIKSDGSGYIYSTFLGGSQTDLGNGIAVDSSGNAYVTGETVSTDFPLHLPFQAHNAGAYDAFIAKLSANGSTFFYSTYLGGNMNDIGAGIALDANNNAYITGQTLSTSGFPTVNPTQAALSGTSDAFVSEINPAGSQLLFSTYLGGSGDEDTTGNFGSIAVDTPGYFIYVTGNTTSTAGFPGQSPYPYSDGNAYGGGPADAFVTKYAQGPIFNITATTPAAVAPGSSASSTLTLTAYNGYNSSVTLSCSVAGTSSLLPACSASGFQPDSVVPAATPGATSTLSITTTGTSGAVLHPRSIFYALWLPVAGLSLVGVGFSSSRRRNRFLEFLMLGMIMTFLLLITACGGGSSGSGGGGGGGGSTGTPAGTYTVTITGTDSNSVSQSTQIAVTVN